MANAARRRSNPQPGRLRTVKKHIPEASSPLPSPPQVCGGEGESARWFLNVRTDVRRLGVENDAAAFFGKRRQRLPALEDGWRVPHTLRANIQLCCEGVKGMRFSFGAGQSWKVGRAVLVRRAVAQRIFLDRGPTAGSGVPALPFPDCPGLAAYFFCNRPDGDASARRPYLNSHFLFCPVPRAGGV